MTVWLRVLIVIVTISAAFAWLTPQLEFRTDVGFFKPSSPSRTMQLALRQIEDGPASNIVLLAISGAKPEHLAEFSYMFKEVLEDTGAFDLVLNGTFTELEDDVLDRLSDYRYLLGPNLDKDSFTVEGLRSDIERTLAQMSGFSGMLLGERFASDPTARLPDVLQSWRPPVEPNTVHGVWFDQSKKNALLTVSIKARDEVGKQRAIDVLDTQFARIKDLSETGLSNSELSMVGPSVFAKIISQSIQREAYFFSVLNSLLLIVLLLSVFRSFPMLLAISVPIGFGILAGIGSLQFFFGHVHGIALTFGITLIAVSVDYPIHVATHVDEDRSPIGAVKTVWPTLVLGAVSTIAAFIPMLLSNFPGLSQFGTFAIVGMVAAAIATRIIIPWVLPTSGVRNAPLKLVQSVIWLRHGQVILLVAAIGCAVVVYLGNRPVFADSLNVLSPLPDDLVRLDTNLREEVGAPDVRRLILVEGHTVEDVLVKQEQLAPHLNRFIEEKKLEGFSSASKFLPSQREQQQRQEKFPNRRILEERLALSLDGLPVSAETLDAFVTDIVRSKTLMPLSYKDLDKFQFIDLRVKSMLFPSGEKHWVGTMPLTNVSATASLKAFVDALNDDSVHFLDLKQESDALMTGYRNESLMWLVLGVVATMFVLLTFTKRPRAIRILVTLACSGTITIAILYLAGVTLTPFHIVSLLLAMGLGLDYALFMSRSFDSALEASQTIFGVLVCAATTVTLFGVMSLSQAPVLHGIGVTVAIGAALSLFCSLAAFGSHLKMVLDEAD